MKKILTIVAAQSGFVFSENDPVFKTMLELPPECCQYVYTREHRDNPAVVRHTEMFRARGMKTRGEGFDGLDSNAVAVTAGYAQKLDPTPLYLKLKEQGVQFLTYLNQTEGIYPGLEPGDFFLYNTETQLRCSIPEGESFMDCDGTLVHVNKGGGEGQGNLIWK